VAQVKMAIVLALLCGLALGPYAHADGAKITRTVWIIVVTITDRSTGERIEERELDSDLRFGGRGQCESIVAKAGLLPDNHLLSTVLTCREITLMSAK
jgi:hypothetical protein